MKSSQKKSLQSSASSISDCILDHNIEDYVIVTSVRCCAAVKQNNNENLQTNIEF